MKAIILAAGLGRRMRPLTDNRHKTLLPIANTTILDRLLCSLRDNDIRDVCVVTGYRAEDIRRVIADGHADLNVTFVHNAEYESTNNVYSMALALESIDLDEDLLLIESDLIVDPRVIEQIVGSRHTNAALVDRYRPGLDGTVVSVSEEDDAIRQVFPSYLQDERFDFSDKYKTLNIYKFGKEFASTTFRELLSFYSRSIDSSCYYELLLGVLIYMRATTVYAEFVEHPWAEVDDPNDLLSAEFAFNPGARREMLEKSWGGYWNMPHLDFAFIRNMYFPTPAVLAEMRTNLGVVVVNYGSSQEVLNRKLSYLEACSPKNVFLLNGASQAFPILRDLFAGARALIPAPTFGEYNRMFPIASTYGDDGVGDVAEIDRLMTDASVVVIVNPNNPTGTVWPTSRIAELAEDNPDRVFIVDESFIDFSDEPSIVPTVEERGLENVIVLKSLSKTLGVPGLRLGYVYTAHPGVLAALWSDVPIWNVNAVAESFLELIMKHRSSLADSFDRLKADRAVFVQRLERLSLVGRVFPSGGNFVLVRLTISPEETENLVDELMTKECVHVKNATDKFSDGLAYLRLAVRRPEENEVLCKLLMARAVVGPQVALASRE